MDDPIVALPPRATPTSTVPTPSFSAHPMQRLVRCFVWLLLLAVPLYGSTGVLLKTIGPAHRHDQPAADTRLLAALGSGAAAVLDTLRAQSGVAKHAHGPGAEPHHHGVFDRHHHAVGDTSVVALGGEAGDVALAAMGSVLLVFALTAPFTAAVPMAQTIRWPAAAPGRLATRAPPPLDRPPRSV